ncbi:putative serine/threonine-protein kinase-like protein CCR3 [Hordeum vulgare]|uniref:Protein kinase domain-containing protein n=1 Tax=Hordeum vulgare subsp. vulgare TaxID=112509 RepID=A0A8I6XE44_HORVV|nr:putative serine/threonine-protein kinase-like protein CCR3 [Hordeum vulgare subsp. vulgare]KAE8798429.1 putative serine/threonine-protein kinase-like protein CCR3 [Hordeum vulgare]
MAATTASLAGLATVAQLALYVRGLVTKITGAAETARQNKLECQNLARRVSVIGDLLLQLQDPGVAQPLAGLGDTLQEAHDLVVACQKWSARRKFLYADEQAERFREVNRRIDSHLILIPLLSHISITRRLDQVVPPSPTSVLLPVAPTMVAASAVVASGSGSRSPQQQYVSSTYVPVEFASAEIAFLTGNFGHVLSEDGSATVYKGRLHDGLEVAVKRLKNHGPRRHEQEGAFVAELETICHLRHDHVVPLVGWCAEDEDRMFVYQYQHTSNGTLRDHLMQGGSASAWPVRSSWKARVQALLGAATAVDHLHRVAEPRIIHRNVSSCSVLLDESWAARVSGFGAAVLQEQTTGGQLVGEVAGTLGYIDPEYSRTRRVSTASDVYSFGVVMLEVMTGRPPSWEGKDPNTLAGFAAPIIEGGNLGCVLDRRPSPEPTPGQMEALKLVAYTAARCLWQQPQDRPAMSNVVTNLAAALGLLIDGDEPKRHY